MVQNQRHLIIIILHYIYLPLLIKNDLMYVTPPNPTTVTTNKLLETPGSNKSTSTSTSVFHFDRASNHTLHDRVTDNNLLDDPLTPVDKLRLWNMMRLYNINIKLQNLLVIKY